MNHSGNISFLCSHIKKVELILIVHFIGPNISKVSFQNLNNIKVIIFSHQVFKIWCIFYIAHFSCSVTTCGWWLLIGELTSTIQFISSLIQNPLFLKYTFIFFAFTHAVLLKMKCAPLLIYF